MRNLEAATALCSTNSYPRFGLYTEDIDSSFLKLLSGMGEVEVHEFDLIQGKEVVYEFNRALRVPSFDVFYGSPITSVNDPYLVELIKRLWYINPRMSAVMKKQLVEGILTRFVATKLVESEVGSGKKAEPVLSFEQVMVVVDKVLSSRVCDPKLNQDRFVFFSKNSKLTKEEKRSLSINARMRAIGKAVDFIIHQRAQILNEQDELLYITTKRIGAIPPEVSIHKINKHMSPTTREFIEESNTRKFFKTEKSLHKFQEYVGLRAEGYTPTQACKEIEVSNSTRTEFLEIERKLNS